MYIITYRAGVGNWGLAGESGAAALSLIMAEENDPALGLLKGWATG